jgi:hypothetical protein
LPFLVRLSTIIGFDISSTFIYVGIGFDFNIFIFMSSSFRSSAIFLALSNRCSFSAIFFSRRASSKRCFLASSALTISSTASEGVTIKTVSHFLISLSKPLSRQWKKAMFLDLQTQKLIFI